MCSLPLSPPILPLPGNGWASGSGKATPGAAFWIAAFWWAAAPTHRWKIFHPLWGIHCAVNRPGAGGVWGPEERLTAQQAVAMYTVAPAMLAGASQELGTLEPGKLADLVVLDRDIFAVPPEEIRTLQVEYTMVGGRFSYKRNR